MKTIAARMVSRLTPQDFKDEQAHDYGNDKEYTEYGWNGGDMDKFNLLYMLVFTLGWRYIKQQGLSDNDPEYKAVMGGLSLLSGLFFIQDIDDDSVDINDSAPLPPDMIASYLEQGSIPWDIQGYLTDPEEVPFQVLSIKRFTDVVRLFFDILMQYEPVKNKDGTFEDLPWQYDGYLNLIEATQRYCEETIPILKKGMTEIQAKSPEDNKRLNFDL